MQSFLLERAGKTWDAVPVPGVSVEDLDKDALNAFRSKAVKSKRMNEQDVAVPDALLLRNLKLYDGNYLTRAAILLFHPDPEQYVTGAYLKVAFFAPAGAYGMNEDADIIYQDDIHGPLIMQADKAIEILYTKYFKALISYEKLQRTETYMLPMGIIRELLLNPINHKQYEKVSPFRFLYLRIILKFLMLEYGLKVFRWMIHYIKGMNQYHIIRKLLMCFIGPVKLSLGAGDF